jgi:ribosomal protein L22
LIQSDVSQNKWIEVFVELKGKGVSHAVDQLKATIDKPVFTHKTIDKRWARIVAQSFPCNTGNSVIERARDYFQKKGIDFKRGTITMEEAI